jgi:hypothetical protein
VTLLWPQFGNADVAIFSLFPVKKQWWPLMRVWLSLALHIFLGLVLKSDGKGRQTCDYLNISNVVAVNGRTKKLDFFNGSLIVIGFMVSHRSDWVISEVGSKLESDFQVISVVLFDQFKYMPDASRPSPSYLRAGSGPSRHSRVLVHSCKPLVWPFPLVTITRIC